MELSKADVPRQPWLRGTAAKVDAHLPLTKAQFIQLCELLVFHVCLPQSFNLALETIDKLPLGDQLRLVYKSRLRDHRNKAAAYVEVVNGRKLCLKPEE